jgi:hypothetical protein
VFSRGHETNRSGVTAGIARAPALASAARAGMNAQPSIAHKPIAIAV